MPRETLSALYNDDTGEVTFIPTEYSASCEVGRRRVN